MASEHADELASWGLGDYADSTPQYDPTKYSQSQGLSSYEATKYGQNSPHSSYEVPKYGLSGPPSPYAEKYIKRADDQYVSAEAIGFKIIIFLTFFFSQYTRLK